MQVIAHRANSIALVQQALDWDCDYAEVDVWENGDGQLLVTRNPEAGGDLLEDVLKLPIGLYLDVREASVASLGRLVAGRERTVIWSSMAYLARLHEFDKALPVMPQAESAENLETVLALWKPGAVAFDERDFVEPLIRLAKQAGALVFVDRLRDFDQPRHWERAWLAGADAIQTDRPRELLRTLGR